MPKKKKGRGKPKAKKSARKKVTKKPAKKKALRKKAAKKKVASRKKAAGKKAARKKAGKAAPKRKAAVKKAAAPKKPAMVAPGPQPTGIPPVEEPAPNEEAVGTVTHYYSHLGVAVIQLNKGSLKSGDTIHLKGHTTDFTQQVESMEFEHQHIDQAAVGQSFGLKVKDHVREHDIVYLVKS